MQASYWLQVFVFYNILKSNFFSQEDIYVVGLPAEAVDGQEFDREMPSASTSEFYM